MSALADKLEEADRLNEISDLHARLLAARTKFAIARYFLKQAIDPRKGVKCGDLEDSISAFLGRYPS
jgi:hypothetical protein